MQKYILILKLLLIHVHEEKRLFHPNFFFDHFSDYDDNPEFTYMEDVKGYTIVKRGGIALVDQKNHTYLKNRKYESTGKIFWTCSGRKKLKCMARVVSVHNKITKITGVHAHPPPDLSLEYVQNTNIKSELN